MRNKNQTRKDKTMQAPSSRRQRTFVVGEQEIRMVSRRITQQANHTGWAVDINDIKSKHFVLGRNEAEDLAYAAWVKRVA